MGIFELSRRFPKEETPSLSQDPSPPAPLPASGARGGRFRLGTYSPAEQIRRSSRSVCANLAEAWIKRRYEGAFVSKLSDCETEAAETQVWLEFAVKCGYLSRDDGKQLYITYDEIIATIVGMINHPETWVLPR